MAMRDVIKEVPISTNMMDSLKISRAQNYARFIGNARQNNGPITMDLQIDVRLGSLGHQIFCFYLSL